MGWWHRTAAAGLVAGGVIGLAYGVFSTQSKRARLVIGRPDAPPLRADGVHGGDPGGRPVRFAVLGDSVAAGLGVDAAAELPGVLLARALAEELATPVRLETHAVVGATTHDLAPQVDRALVDPPDVVLVIVGANDVTTRTSIPRSAAALGAQVRRLRDAGVDVVVGTCPDLGSIRPIAQPLRAVASGWSLRLARAQWQAVTLAGGVPVALGDLLGAEFTSRGRDYFSRDQFHPSAAGYEATASVLLAPLYGAAATRRRDDVRHEW
ncbi:SGNH/GDSL hydrolase family protein [Actinosynnema sp. NPDC050436]|uniref:SGNH/GDSL hydrolase family protein n=1 Tax=Actinosynnema sp. NPDC050436 TaxID=3155659 RepID=UPI0033F6B053